MQKRLISMVLALSMALTAMPLPALAQSDPPDTASAAALAEESGEITNIYTSDSSGKPIGDLGDKGDSWSYDETSNTLTLKNGAFQLHNYNYDSYNNYIKWNLKIEAGATLQEAQIGSNYDDKYTVTNTGTISGGTFYATVTCAAGAVVSGGTFKKDITVDAAGGKVTIDGGTFEYTVTIKDATLYSPDNRFYNDGRVENSVLRFYYIGNGWRDPAQSVIILGSALDVSGSVDNSSTYQAVLEDCYNSEGYTGNGSIDNGGTIKGGRSTLKLAVENTDGYDGNAKYNQPIIDGGEYTFVYNKNGRYLNDPTIHVMAAKEEKDANVLPGATCYTMKYTPPENARFDANYISGLNGTLTGIWRENLTTLYVSTIDDSISALTCDRITSVNGVAYNGSVPEGTRYSSPIDLSKYGIPQTHILNLSATDEGAAEPPEQPPQEDSTEYSTLQTVAILAGTTAWFAGSAVMGYEAVTYSILADLLPKGTPIPRTREQLAVLLWSTAGKPEPAAPAVYSDVAEPDTAKAARWAVEAGLLPDMGEGVFTPGKRVTKVQVIRAWNQLKKLGLAK